MLTSPSSITPEIFELVRDVRALKPEYRRLAQCVIREMDKRKRAKAVVLQFVHEGGIIERL